jgi:hypothetical protein
MTRHLFSCAMVPFLSLALVAQQAPQVSAPASQAPAPVPAAAPAPPPSAGILQDGTPMKLRLLNKLDSHTAKDGDEIPFDVVNDVVVGGVTVLRRGSPATGVVTQAAASKTMGRAGKLSFTINDIQLRNGGKAPVRAFNRTSGENRTGEMIGLMIQAPMVAARSSCSSTAQTQSFPAGRRSRPSSTETSAWTWPALVQRPLPRRLAMNSRRSCRSAPPRMTPRFKSTAPPPAVRP